jgi:hypothetical protein
MPPFAVVRVNKYRGTKVFTNGIDFHRQRPDGMGFDYTTISQDLHHAVLNQNSAVTEELRIAA